MKREDLLSRSDDALGILLVRLDQLAAECDRAQFQGGGHQINEEKFQVRLSNFLCHAIYLRPLFRPFSLRLVINHLITCLDSVAGGERRGHRRSLRIGFSF